MLRQKERAIDNVIDDKVGGGWKNGRRSSKFATVGWNREAGKRRRWLGGGRRVLKILRAI